MNARPPAMSLTGKVRRLLVYVVFDRVGHIDDFIPYSLGGLREHADTILVVVNGDLTEAGRARLEQVCDEIIVRENVGFDIGAHRDALGYLGERIADYDEIVLTNDTWFGPVRPWAPVFDRMDARPIHFWGLTDHEAQRPNPFTGTGVMPYHLQSYWIAIRRELFLSDDWKGYWENLPPLRSYRDAVLRHEIAFTEHFTNRGWVAEAVFPWSAYDTENPSLFEADVLIDDGSPALKRRPLFHWPPFLDAHAVIGKWTLERAAAHGYPVDMAMANLARTVPPKVLNADAGLLSVVPDTAEPVDEVPALRVVVVAHIFYDEMTDEILDRADNLPTGYDLIVTTPDPDRAARIRATLARRRPDDRRSEVRVLTSNDGRDQSAFLIGCRDVIMSGEYDIVVKLHSKKTPQDGYNVGRHFKDQQFGNLLASRGYAANVLALFQGEPGLGLVYPPMIHLGYPTLGRAWWSNKAGFALLASELGISVPLDDVSPLAPYGSMFIARPEALRLLVDHPWRYEQFGGAEAYRDGGLAHILERMPSYAAGELGYHTRTICTFDYMSLSHTALEFKLDEMSFTIPGQPFEKIDFVRGAGWVGTGSGRDILRMYMRKNHMRAVHRARRIMDPARWPGRWIARVRRRGNQ